MKVVSRREREPTKIENKGYIPVCADEGTRERRQGEKNKELTRGG